MSASARRTAAPLLAAIVAFLVARGLGGQTPAALVIQPSLLELSPRPGERIARAVTLVNSGQAPLTVSTRISDWTMDLSGEVSFLAPGRAAASCSAWIRVEPPVVTVPAGGNARVRVELLAPAGASGTHWSSVLFELPPSQAPLGGRFTTVVPRVGLTVYATPAGTAADDFDLEELAASRNDAGGATVRALFFNRGNSAIRSRVDWQIKSSDGKFVRAYEVLSVVALPGSRRQVIARTGEPIPPGDYVVSAMARWGDRRWSARDVALSIPATNP